MKIEKLLPSYNFDTVKDDLRDSIESFIENQEKRVIKN